MSKLRSSFKKSLFNRYFAICSAIILATIALMGGLIIGFSASYFRNTNQASLKKSAEQAVQVTLSSMEKYDYKMIPSGTLRFGYGIISNASDAVVKLKALEAFSKAADGQATKIIIPSEIQSLAGLAEGITEAVKK